MEALAKFGGKLVELMLAVDGDGLTGGVEDYFAVVAFADMGLNLGEELWVDFAVEVVVVQPLDQLAVAIASPETTRWALWLLETTANITSRAAMMQ